MATVLKNFRIKSGLVVDGTTATINTFDILTKKQADQDYIVNLIGGTATSLNTPDTVVKRDGSGDFAAGTITADLVGDVTGNADTATALETARTIQLTGNVTGTVSFDGTSDVQIATTIDSSFATDSEVAAAKQEAVDEAKLYTDGKHSEAIDAIPTSTDELTEGTSNVYFTNIRARNALSAGSGLDYSSASGEFAVSIGNGLELDGNDIVVDTDIIATKTYVTTTVEDHSDLTTGVHGVTGDVVGTTDTQTLTNKTLGSGTTLSTNLDAGGFTLTNLAAPDQASDAATKEYVDNLAEGLHVHASVAAATASDISLAPAPVSIDNVTLTNGMRVLVKAQTNAAENGIYEFNGTDLVRASDYNTLSEIDPGDFVFVDAGDTFGNTGWVQTENLAELGTSAIYFTQFSGAGTVVVTGPGLLQMGNQIYLDFNDIATPTNVSDAVSDHELLDTGIHGLTGTADGVFVGTDKTQTLTNKTLGSGTVLSAALDAGYVQIQNLGAPTADADAATKFYVDNKVFDLQNEVENLTTDDVPEGITPESNRYFTDERAEQAVATFLNNATLTNLTFMGSSGSYVLAAENGVADSTTDDLTEGDDNLYFTNTRGKASAVDLLVNDFGTRDGITITQNAMNGVDIVVANALEDATTDDVPESANPTNLYFTSERAIAAIESQNNITLKALTVSTTGEDASKLIAETIEVANAGVAEAAYWQLLDGDGDTNTDKGFTSGEFLIKVSWSGGSEVTKVMFTSDDQFNVYITEFGTVASHGSPTSAISVRVETGTLQKQAILEVTTLNNNSVVSVIGTLLK